MGDRGMEQTTLLLGTQSKSTLRNTISCTTFNHQRIQIWNLDKKNSTIYVGIVDGIHACSEKVIISFWKKKFMEVADNG